MISTPYFRRTVAKIIFAFPVFVLTATPKWASAAQDVAKHEPSAVIDQPLAIDNRELGLARLAQIAGFDDDAAYVRSIASRVDELAAQAERVDDRMKRADLLAAAVNLILAHQVEPYCSRRLLQLQSDDDVVDKAESQSAFDRADELIARAKTARQEWSAQQTLKDRDPATSKRNGLSPGPALRSGPAEVGQRLETLQAFASGLRAYLLPGSNESRRAASGLAPLIEDRNRAVSAAATLWQACLRSSDSEPDRALSVLAPPLANPAPGSMPYAFFARLLRCRLIAERGGEGKDDHGPSPTAALALLMQIEERCDEWLADAVQRDNAMRAAQLVRLQILADWSERLALKGRVAERKWCMDRIKELWHQFETGPTPAGEGNDTVLRLSPAIPIIARSE